MEEKVLIGFLIKQIHIAFETRCHKNLQRYNLTPSQMDILLYLTYSIILLSKINF